MQPLCSSRWRGAALDGGKRTLNPLQRRIAGGCLLDREIDRLVRDAGFEIDRLDRFVHPGGPRVMSEMYRGVARR